MTTMESPDILALASREANYKIAQALYHAVTGKTEKLTRNFSENYCIKITDIEQLEAKLLQISGQWRVEGCNRNIAIQHIDDNGENFSSIERFKNFYDKSRTSPVEGITFEFSLLLILPNVEKPQPYKVTVRIVSPIAVVKKIEEDDSLPSARIIRFFRNEKIIVEIEYVDYVVARNILATLESWVKQIEIASANKILRKIQRYSHWIPRICSAVMMLLSTIVSFCLVDSVLNIKTSNFAMLAKFFLVSLTFIVASTNIGMWVGRMSEWGIDSLQEPSYIQLNIGDDRLIEEFKKRNKKFLVRAILSFILVTIHAISCGIIGNYLYSSLLIK